MEKENASWLKSLEKTITGNSQLEFWPQIQISYQNIETKLPEIEMLRFRKFIILSNKCTCLIATLDKRSHLYNHLIQNPKVQICWFFPLSREKYRIKCQCTLWSVSDFNNGDKIKEVPLNFEQLKQIWSSLTKEEKKEFTEGIPDIEIIEKPLKKHDDLNDFNTPEVEGISRNFGIIVLEPYEVEHTKFAMPQVIADARTTKFESLFSPYKHPQKYLHIKDSKNNLEWAIKSLNP